MAKKNSSADEATNGQRQSRKEYLRQKKHEEQLRVIYIAAGVVVGLLILILVIAGVNEFIVAPGRSVATVNGEEISLTAFQERVKFERAQRILSLENQLELFGGDVGPIQQFSVQTILELQDAEAMGEGVVNLMAEEKLIAQEVEARGLTPSEDDIDQRIGAFFNYFGGGLPTPSPEPTATIAPTPSLTPIGFEAAVEDDSQPSPTPGPTSTPLPTSTPVSGESYQEQYDEFVTDLTNLGVDASTYRNVMTNQIVRERLTDALSEEQALAEEDEHASFFIITFADEEEANRALSEVGSGDFVTYWNDIRSQPPPPPPEDGSQDDALPDPPVASEVLWRTGDSLRSSFNDLLASTAFESELQTPSDVIEIQGADGSSRFALIYVTGREQRPLAAAEYQARKDQLLRQFLDAGQGGIEIGEFWRQRVPVVPVLDSKFLQPATPAPEASVVAPSDEGLAP